MKANLLMSTTCIALCIGLVALPLDEARAQELGTLYYYPLTEADYQNNRQAWRVFMEYDQRREPCQNYVAPPAGFVMKGCHIYREDRYVPTQTTTTQSTKTVVTERTAPSVPYYTIYFDFDKSDIRPNERAHLAEIAKELQKFNLEEVTISAHADSAGAADYNQRLSERRARAVANALNQYGIRTSVINERAYGERAPVVMLGDGARSQENRRAVIHYKH